MIQPLKDSDHVPSLELAMHLSLKGTMQTTTTTISPVSIFQWDGFLLVLSGLFHSVTPLKEIVRVQGRVLTELDEEVTGSSETTRIWATGP
jgi:hypothetical protein